MTQTTLHFSAVFGHNEATWTPIASFFCIVQTNLYLLTLLLNDPQKGWTANWTLFCKTCSGWHTPLFDFWLCWIKFCWFLRFFGLAGCKIGPIPQGCVFGRKHTTWIHVCLLLHLPKICLTKCTLHVDYYWLTFICCTRHK